MTDTLADDAPRPMTEAPRDGTKVLAWWPSLPHDDETGAWATTWFETNAGRMQQWHTPWEHSNVDDHYAPTHFLPHPGEPE